MIFVIGSVMMFFCRIYIRRLFILDKEKSVPSLILIGYIVGFLMMVGSMSVICIKWLP